ncbi:uncharacterized protein BP01DRAFT_318334 [Aspergillus saccharolyticus JOP 1030-1]|uniref:Uncharacterized protein n=1 Tax=Aspergillus saccharolyticus JOP 1030-1 TaxID=1450539 RepID=A0A318ZDZ4_9EURO|nr:hypothetical protein BP01DRAFT_318334 [Aspergillus saccharolyticus JOP 1030-1]PYH45746.1 hypothetical protein BP01DRAFT_318334 [Aspergillus saccharolyticus JOP 1030-1]
MSKHQKLQDSSILGESWVVAPSPLVKELPLDNKNNNNNQTPHQTHTTPHPKQSHHDSLSESISTSCSSISGPELIMPSIYEAPIAEGSWIAPIASPQRALRRRNPSSSTAPITNAEQQSSTKARKGATPTPTVAQHGALSRRPPPILPSRGFILRTLLNVLLLVGICHLLILPELVQQHQSLCAIPVLATLYPVSCIPVYLQRPNGSTSQSNGPFSHQSTLDPLQTLLDTTLQTMTPHSTTLKHTESKLRDIHQLLKKQYPGSKHELDLEFSGCLEATRTATRRFDSLHADLRSAVDSLIAARGSSGNDRGSAAAATTKPTHFHTSPDARLSTTQLTRREQYVDQLTSRMLTKADSLLGDFATLDDHLDSIADVLKRETNRRPPAPQAVNDDRRQQEQQHLPHGPGSSPAGGIKGILVGALFGTGTGGPRSPQRSHQNDERSNAHTQPLPILFHDAATRHQPVLAVIQKLSDELQQLQNKRGGTMT